MDQQRKESRVWNPPFPIKGIRNLELKFGKNRSKNLLPCIIYARFKFSSQTSKKFLNIFLFIGILDSFNIENSDI